MKVCYPKALSPHARAECSICGATHRYNCPHIGPVQFLHAVADDPTALRAHRLRAIAHLLDLYDRGIDSDPKPEPTHTVTSHEPKVQ